MGKLHATIPLSFSNDEVAVSSSDIGVELSFDVRPKGPAEPGIVTKFTLPARHARILATALEQAADHAERRGIIEE